jgi:hypothetical protein
VTEPDQPPVPAGDDVLLLSRWDHDGVPMVRVRTGGGADLGAVAGEAAILAVVAAWLRGGAARDAQKIS